jgi:hypothetical protein
LQAIAGADRIATMNIEQSIEKIYESLNNDNADIDLHIANLKNALIAEGKKEAVFEPGRLAQNNREGRKMMQAYFRKRGVAVSFSK